MTEKRNDLRTINDYLNKLLTLKTEENEFLIKQNQYLKESHENLMEHIVIPMNRDYFNSKDEDKLNEEQVEDANSENNSTSSFLDGKWLEVKELIEELNKNNITQNVTFNVEHVAKDFDVAKFTETLMKKLKNQRGML